MELIGAVVVGLLIVIAGLLVLLHIQGEERRTRTEQHHERAEQRHAERRAQDFEATRAIVETLHLVGHALAAEVREAARQHRNDLRLANRLPSVNEPPRTWSTPPTTSRSASASASASSRRADEETSAPHDHDEDPPSLPSPVAPPSLPSFEPNEDDEQTPTSGWTAEQTRRHFADANRAEGRSQ